LLLARYSHIQVIKSCLAWVPTCAIFPSVVGIPEREALGDGHNQNKAIWSNRPFE
jgi:hypothetical protein